MDRQKQIYWDEVDGWVMVLLLKRTLPWDTSWEEECWTDQILGLKYKDMKRKCPFEKDMLFGKNENKEMTYWLGGKASNTNSGYPLPNGTWWSLLLKERNETDEWGRSTHRVLCLSRKGDSHCEKIYLKHVSNTRTHIDNGTDCNQSSLVNQLISLWKPGALAEVPAEGSL